MSWALGQEINGTFHIFKEYHAQTMRTQELLEDMAEQGAFELPVTWEIFGDAAGKHSDTRSLWSDYEIIEKFISNFNYLAHWKPWISYSFRKI